jgi:NADH-quinone oxidoreductase subunit F
VFLAVGAPTGTNLRMLGSDAQGVTEAMSFLRHYNIRGSVPVGKNVVVIGGGNAAIDAARTAMRLGSESVTILYRRTREEMPAYAEEIEESQQEGVTLKTLSSPEEFIVKDGRVSAVRCRVMQLGAFDQSGRRRPQASQEDFFELPADQVIMAVGQSLEVGGLIGSERVDLTLDGWIKADPVTGQTSTPWLYAGGDDASGPSSVVAAIGAGERAAAGIDKFLTGEDHAFWRPYREIRTNYDPEADPVPYAREQPPLTPLDRRRNNFDEVEQPWNEATAVRQAKRCLRCDFGKGSDVKGACAK